MGAAVTLYDFDGREIETDNPLPVSEIIDGEALSPTNPVPSSEPDLLINVQIDSVDSFIEYIGLAVMGSTTSEAVWKIKKVNYITGTVILYADSNKDFDNIFDDRETLNYG